MTLQHWILLMFFILPPLAPAIEAQVLKFSKSPISEANFDKLVSETNFTGNDFIYAKLKFPKPKREMGLENGLIAYLRLDDNTLASPSFLEFKAQTQDELDDPFYDIDLACAFKDSRNPSFTQKFLAGLAKLEPGKSYRLTLKVLGFTSNRKDVEFADTEITLDLTKGGGIIKSLAENFANSALAAVQLPKPARDDKPLAAEILKLMKSQGFDATKVIFSTDGWLTQRKPNGEIDHRSIFAYVVFKNKSGGCEYQEFRFAQDYVGGKFENRTYRSGSTGKGGQIGCDKLK